MKVSGNSLGVFGISPAKRKRFGGRRPPWYIEVPPDTVDIALIPRINRYERGSLKFHILGSTQQKVSERLALFREAMDIVPPGLAHSEEEMRDGLEEVMRERAFLLEEHARKFAELHQDPSDSQNEDINSEDQIVDTTVALPSLESDEVKNSAPAVRYADLSEELEDIMGQEVEEKQTDDDASWEGVPTQWLIDRLNAQGKG